MIASITGAGHFATVDRVPVRRAGRHADAPAAFAPRAPRPSSLRSVPPRTSAAMGRAMASAAWAVT